MLKDAIKPTIKDLQPLVDEVMADGRTKSEFVSSYIKGVAETLRKKPNSYLAYGMFWWSIKKLLISEGVNEFGETIEAITPSVFDYPDPVYTCASAWAYHHDNIELGYAYNPEHTVPLIGGDQYDYYLHDLDMVEYAKK